MSRIRAVLTDLDGTILFPNGSFTNSTRRTIKVLAQRGILVAPVTGRSLRAATDICRDLGIHGMGVFNGGSVIADLSTAKTIWEQPLEDPIAIIHDIAPLCKFLSFGQGRIRANELRKDITLLKCHSIWAEVHYKNISAIEDIIHNYAKAVMHTNSAFNKGHVGVQINHHYANKQFGVQKLMTILDLNPADVAAIGDDNNDIPFFEAVGTKIAMGNAPSGLVEIADFRTSTIGEEGFSNAMKRYVLGAK